MYLYYSTPRSITTYLHHMELVSWHKRSQIQNVLPHSLPPPRHREHRVVTTEILKTLQALNLMCQLSKCWQRCWNSKCWKIFALSLAGSTHSVHHGELGGVSPAGEEDLHTPDCIFCPIRRHCQFFSSLFQVYNCN